MDFYLEPDKAFQSVLSAPCKLNYGKQLSQEINLPDFYEDLARIIDCSAKAVVSERKITEGELYVTGEVSYSILYYSDKDSVLHRFSFEQEFDAKWDIEENAELLDVLLYTREPVVRVYGTRKFTVNMDCDFTAYFCKRQNCKIPDTENARFMQKQGESFTYECLESEKSRFTEDFLLPSQYPPLEELVYWELMQGSVKTDIRPDGLIVSSDAQLSVIYTDKDGDYVSYKTKLPLTRFIRSDGGEAVSSELLVYLPKCAAISDSTGENRCIALDFELSARSVVYKKTQFTYVSDAYCTDCRCKLETCEIYAGREEGIYEKQFTVKDTIENDGEIKEILSVRTVPELSKIRRDEEMLYGEGNLKCTVLVKTESGSLSAYEHDMTFDISLKLSENTDNTVIKLETEKINFEAVKDGFALDIDVKLCVNGFSQSTSECVIQILKGEKDETCDDCSMLIYYPDKEESLWDIGKRHRVDTEKIAQINKLESDELKNKKFILIPKK